VSDYFISGSRRGAVKNGYLQELCADLGQPSVSISIQFEDIFYRERKTSCCLMQAWPPARPWATTFCGGLGDYLGENVSSDLARQPEHRDGDREAAGAGDRMRLSPLREEEGQANTLGLVITAAMLFVLFAAAMLFGSRGTIGSMPHPTISTPDAKAMGNLMYGMRRVAPCPQTSFGNATGSVPGPAERCFGSEDDAAGHPHD
jgi:hypothetical protein